MVHNLENLHDLFWREAFRAAMRVGIIRDGHYGPEDVDALVMYCGGCEL